MYGMCQESASICFFFEITCGMKHASKRKHAVTVSETAQVNYRHFHYYHNMQKETKCADQ
jgi:hypothetical protein